VSVTNHGKRKAGRTLDGRTWEQYPPLASEP
jgi:protein gp37